VEDSAVSAEAWQPSAHDDDNDESPSEPLTVTLPTTEPGLRRRCVSLSHIYTQCDIVTVDVGMLACLCVFLVVGRSQMAVLTH